MIARRPLVGRDLVERPPGELDEPAVDVAGDRDRALVLPDRGQLRVDRRRRPAAPGGLLKEDHSRGLVFDERTDRAGARAASLRVVLEVREDRREPGLEERALDLLNVPIEDDELIVEPVADHGEVGHGRSVVRLPGFRCGVDDREDGVAPNRQVDRLAVHEKRVEREERGAGPIDELRLVFLLVDERRRVGLQLLEIGAPARDPDLEGLGRLPEWEERVAPCRGVKLPEAERRVVAYRIEEVVRVDPVRVRHHERAAGIVDEGRLDRPLPRLAQDFLLSERGLVDDDQVVLSAAAGVLVLERPEVDAPFGHRADDLALLRAGLHRLDHLRDVLVGFAQALIFRREPSDRHPANDVVRRRRLAVDVLPPTPAGPKRDVVPASRRLERADLLRVKRRKLDRDGLADGVHQAAVSVLTGTGGAGAADRSSRDGMLSS